MIRRPPRSTLDRSSAASDVYKRQVLLRVVGPVALVAADPMLYDELMRMGVDEAQSYLCLLYTSPSPRDRTRSRMPSSA